MSAPLSNIIYTNKYFILEKKLVLLFIYEFRLIGYVVKHAIIMMNYIKINERKSKENTQIYCGLTIYLHPQE